jgi:23S rRNA pseudouridine1911/1915/1917 synthase
MNDTVTREAVVPTELAGQRLDRAAAEIWSDFSRSRIRQWIDSGALTVDGATVLPRLRLKGGEKLVVDAELEQLVEMAPEPIPLDIVYEDEDVIVLNKPAGLVVHPGAGNPGGTLLNALLFHDAALALVPRAGLVHRLDKDTSGLLVVARNLSSQQRLVEMIEQRDVRRTYEAVCQTVLTGGGVIDAPIDRNPRDRTKMAVRQGGREARTHYRVKARFRAHTHVGLELETGRTHQIRVHMAHIRAPLVGDPVYGGRPRLPAQPGEALRSMLQQFPRQALHARALEFPHPRSREPMQLTAPLPDDMTALIGALAADLAEHSG